MDYVLKINFKCEAESINVKSIIDIILSVFNKIKAEVSKQTTNLKCCVKLKETFSLTTICINALVLKRII